MCCLRCIQAKENNFNATCICRVPKARLSKEQTVECISCGCRCVYLFFFVVGFYTSTLDRGGFELVSVGGGSYSCVNKTDSPFLLQGLCIWGLNQSPLEPSPSQSEYPPRLFRGPHGGTFLGGQEDNISKNRRAGSIRPTPRSFPL